MSVLDSFYLFYSIKQQQLFKCIFIFKSKINHLPPLPPPDCGDDHARILHPSDRLVALYLYLSKQYQHNRGTLQDIEELLVTECISCLSLFKTKKERDLHTQTCFLSMTSGCQSYAVVNSSAFFYQSTLLEKRHEQLRAAHATNQARLLFARIHSKTRHTTSDPIPLPPPDRPLHPLPDHPDTQTPTTSTTCTFEEDLVNRCSGDITTMKRSVALSSSMAGLAAHRRPRTDPFSAAPSSSSTNPVNSPSPPPPCYYIFPEDEDVDNNDDSDEDIDCDLGTESWSEFTTWETASKRHRAAQDFLARKQKQPMSPPAAPPTDDETVFKKANAKMSAFAARQRDRLKTSSARASRSSSQDIIDLDQLPPPPALKRYKHN